MKVEEKEGRQSVEEAMSTLFLIPMSSSDLRTRQCSDQEMPQM